jgi:hypothetical protein
MTNISKSRTNLSYAGIAMTYEVRSYTRGRIVHKIDDKRDESVNDLSACAQEIPGVN